MWCSARCVRHTDKFISGFYSDFCFWWKITCWYFSDSNDWAWPKSTEEHAWKNLNFSRPIESYCSCCHFFIAPEALSLSLLLLVRTLINQFREHHHQQQWKTTTLFGSSWWINNRNEATVNRNWRRFFVCGFFYKYNNNNLLPLSLLSGALCYTSRFFEISHFISVLFSLCFK